MLGATFIAVVVQHALDILMCDKLKDSAHPEK